MPSGFVATSVSALQLLAEPATLFIPEYQRPYSWTIVEAQQLLDDVLIAMGDSSEAAEDGYFLGTMLLMVRPRDGERQPGVGEPDSGERDIVDGQQRIITLTILLSVLRDLAADRGMPISHVVNPLIWRASVGSSERTPRVRLRGREQQFFRAFIQEDNASFVMPSEDELTVGETRILAVREHFAGTLVDLEPDDLERLAAYLTSSCHFAVITARSIDRAHRIFAVLNSRGRPLARNDILKAQIFSGIAPESRAQFVPVWDRIEQRLGSEFEALFSHIRTIEGHGHGRIISGISELIEAAGGAQRFVENTLAPYAEIYEAMQMRPSAAGDPRAAVGQYLAYLGWLGSEDWVPVMMRFWRQCAGAPSELLEFGQRLDRFAYCLRLLGLGADKRQARFAALLGAVKRGTWRDTADNPLELGRDDIRNIQYNLRNLHGRSQLTCKLVLLRLNDKLAGRPQQLDPGDFTVEHVLPQKPGRTSHWRTWFPDSDEREQCMQSLGNLVLVTRSQNDRARNMDLPRKLEVYFGDGAAAALPITRELQTISEWKAPQILEREQRILSMIRELWSIETIRGEEPSSGPKRRPSRRARPAE